MSNLQELKDLLAETLSNTENSDNGSIRKEHNINTIMDNLFDMMNQTTLLNDNNLTNEDEDEHDRIPDLITPPSVTPGTLTPRNNLTRDEQDESDNNVKNDVVNNVVNDVVNDVVNEKSTHCKEYDIEQNERDCETDCCNRILYGNDVFIYQMTNTLLTLLLMTEFMNLVMYTDRMSLSLFLLNTLMFVFYNANHDIMVDTQRCIIGNMYKYVLRLFTNTKSQLKLISQSFMDYFFSKNTQMILRFAYNITKNKAIQTYTEYRDWAFNPPLLVKTNKDNVYSVSFYLNGEYYKVPIVVPRYSLDKKSPPLMILDKNEDDVTQKYKQLLGPNNDFYGLALKPKQLGEKNLNFMMEDGTEMNINENDIMVL